MRDHERIESDEDFGARADGEREPTPLRLAFSEKLRGSLLSASGEYHVPNAPAAAFDAKLEPSFACTTSPLVS